MSKERLVNSDPTAVVLARLEGTGSRTLVLLRDARTVAVVPGAEHQRSKSCGGLSGSTRVGGTGRDQLIHLRLFLVPFAFSFCVDPCACAGLGPSAAREKRGDRAHALEQPRCGSLSRHRLTALSRQTLALFVARASTARVRVEHFRVDPTIACSSSRH
ncbi:hypothetical protein PybrP1_000629 [[Pythium] brassicae (nom. inval.)]|nr:hypothetical protein PybrP1_000629 [[Pythium] brassicae (nom. inval.)]